ncbi:hypothetical protein ABK040_000160 [Willaertia magna]
MSSEPITTSTSNISCYEGITDIHALREEIRKVLTRGIPQDELPPKPVVERDPSVPHAPTKNIDLILTKDEQKLAIKNALRYFPKKFHKELAEEFIHELKTYGHVYMYRFRPTTFDIRAYTLEDYPAKSKHAASIMFMIFNNLDKKVAQYPHELVTYGGNGSVFSNWGQFLLVMKYLSEMTDEQTLVMYSGHPLGLFPSNPWSPRVVITNGLTVPNYSTRDDYEKMYAMGNTIYGQMTAGSYCYIGSQGIVHGTTLVILNAGRKYLGLEDLSGKVFVTSGLGGMSGAQPKAGVISGCISVVAEINPSALNKRLEQGWLAESAGSDVEKCVERIKQARKNKEVVSIGYLGNVVDLWERLAEEDELLVELGSDQTSLHNPFAGGYYPVGKTFEEANQIMKDNPQLFKELVQQSLVRQVSAINKLTKKGMKFWDYGNCFLYEARNAGADIVKEGGDFKYPSYVQDIMGNIFALGFGPFRYICTSNDPKDLETADKIATQVIEELRKTSPPKSTQQYDDNYRWIVQAAEHKLVVGSQARILYSDIEGRMKISLEFNKAIREGRIKGQIVLSRDHHDVSGADSPFRETSDMYDGSNKTADMSVHTFVGNAIRGTTYCALHNGGGVGFGLAINCGFGLVLDGTEEADEKVKGIMLWDVSNGITRRSWSGNENAYEAIERAMELHPNLKVTLPEKCDFDFDI